jgi:NAD(P)-dependent dehydrogenase (short-subunit alcohol dehydrogenase family)
MTVQTNFPTIELSLKVAIVTGGGAAGHGIGNGRAAAIQLARLGARTLVVDSDLEAAQRTVDMVRAEGYEAAALAANVTVPTDCQKIVDYAVEHWGRVDILVNNVGIAGPRGTVVDVDLEEWDRCIAVNLTSMMLMCRFAIPAMTKSGEGGAIINISSAAGLAGGYPHVTYSTTKGAVTNFTKQLAAAHGPSGIRANAIAPGFVYTPMVEAAGLADDGREFRAKAAPLGVEGTAWDIANCVAFLAGPLSRWITGVLIPVDAGLTSTLTTLGATQHSASRR